MVDGAEYRRIIEDAPIGIFESLPEGRFVWVNLSLARLLGFAGPDEVVEHYRNLAEQFYVDPQDRGRILQLLEADDVVSGYEFPAKNRYGEPLWVSVSARRVSLKPDGSYRISGYLLDRSANRRLEERLRRTQEVYRQTVENSPNPIFCLDLEGMITLLNRSALELFEAESGILGEHFGKLGITLADGSDIGPLVSACSEGRAMANLEMRYIDKAGKTHFLLSRAYPIFEEGWVPNGCVFAGTDITERIRMQDELSRELRQKQLLLQEVHHRVKNNLQMVSSLLSLQSNYLENENDRDRFLESTERIRSIAMVHEQLYLSEDLESVDMKAYFTALFADYRIHYPSVATRVRFDLNVEELTMDLNQALPTALLVNELVNNAVKHAFSDVDTGSIGVRLRREGDDYLLRVEDDGSGIPEEVNVKGTESLGLQIVHSLCLQLGGTSDVSSSGGTAWTVRFPVRSEGGPGD